MPRVLRNPKALTIIVLLGVMFLLGLAGGALGHRFGGGFLASPLPHIQIPAEPVSATPIIGDFKITNTMVATWLTIGLLTVVAFLGTRRVTEVPGRLQGALEAVLEFFLDLAESIAGPSHVRRFLPLVMTIFLFIVTANWLGILPGFGTIGRVETAEEVIHHAEEAAKKDGGHAELAEIKLQVFDVNGVSYLPLNSLDSDNCEQTRSCREVSAEKYRESGGVVLGKKAGLLVPFLRSANTDLNTTLAIALVAMFMVEWWGIRALGLPGHLSKFLNLRGGFIGIFVGIIEAISEVARIISFTFRLFGNMFAGEVLLVAMGFLIPLVGLIPFLGLELFVGLIQAFIFSILTLVFAAAATEGHEAEAAH